MTAPFPLSPAPAGYCTMTPVEPYGIHYLGEDNVAFNLSQQTATTYEVYDRNFDQVASGSAAIVPVPCLANDLALGFFAMWTPQAGQDTGPTFTPGGAGTNHFAEADFTSLYGNYFKLSASLLQQGASTVRPKFTTTLPGPTQSCGLLALIKSATGHVATPVQAVTGHSTVSSGVTVTTVAPTSTDSLLAVAVVGFGDASVVDNAGNVWAPTVKFVGDLTVTATLFTTTAAHPASITSVTVTNGIGAHCFIEISGANNTDPIDLARGNVTTGSSTLATVTLQANTLDIPAPARGWLPGWYRVRLKGPVHDAVFGDSYGVSNFVVLRDDPHFLPRSALPASEISVEGAPWLAGIKGLLGIGTSRIDYTAAWNPTPSADVLAAVSAGKQFWTQSGYVDPIRPRHLWVAFPNGTTDSIRTPGNSHSNGGLQVVAKPAHAGAPVYITQTAGTNPSTVRIKVFSPNSSTLVEDFDNFVIASGVAPIGVAITAASNYISAQSTDDAFLATTMTTPTLIGNSYFNGVKGVVETLYPDVKYYEGPSNEPDIRSFTVLAMGTFQAAVHAGNAAAKAMGPCPVHTDDIPTFIANGGLAYCDVFSLHDYDTFGGSVYDMHNARRLIDLNVKTPLANAGRSDIEIWQTEAGNDGVDQRVYSPRRARNLLLHVLLWEQYGIAREHNPVWYDKSHGFFDVPVWLVNIDGSLQPQCTLWRVLAEETWGQLHDAIMDFGALGNFVFAGSIYAAPSGASTAVIWAASAMPACTVTLTVTGTTSPLTVSDCEGKLSTVAVVKGRATVPVADVPTYVRLPVGVSVEVYSCLDWPANDVNGQGFDDAPRAVGLVSGAATGPWSPSQTIAAPFVNGVEYRNAFGYVGPSAHALPDTALLTWPQSSRADRLLIFGAPPSGPYNGLLDFDVQTSVDGTNWVTQATVTKTGPFTVLHGSDLTNSGSQRESSYDDQWIFNVKFPRPVAFKAVRLYVRATTYGHGPDEASAISMGSGSTSQEQYLVLQKIFALCDANTRPQMVVAS